MIPGLSPSARGEVDLVIAFVDLTYFEKQGHQVGARDLADTIDEYYERVGIEVAKANGTLIKFIGDAALMVFSPADLDQAIEMLLGLKPAVDGFMQQVGWQSRLTARAHLGSVMAGPFGLRHSKQLDVIGAAVNAAARLRSTGVTVSQSVYDRLRDDLKVRFRKALDGGAFIRSED